MSLDVGGGDQAAAGGQLRPHHQHLVDPEIACEKPIRRHDRIGGQGLIQLGNELGARGHDLGDFFGFIAFLDHVAGDEPDQSPLGVDHGEGGEGETLGLNQSQHLGDGLLGTDGDRILDQAVNMTLYPRHFLHLVPRRHIVVNESEAAVERHRHRHARLRHRIHIRSDDRNRQAQGLRQAGRSVRVLGQHL